MQITFTCKHVAIRIYVNIAMVGCFDISMTIKLYLNQQSMRVNLATKRTMWRLSKGCTVVA